MPNKVAITRKERRYPLLDNASLPFSVSVWGMVQQVSLLNRAFSLRFFYSKESFRTLRKRPSKEYMFYKVALSLGHNAFIYNSTPVFLCYMKQILHYITFIPVYNDPRFALINP